MPLPHSHWQAEAVAPAVAVAVAVAVSQCNLCAPATRRAVAATARATTEIGSHVAEYNQCGTRPLCAYVYPFALLLCSLN